MTIFFKEGRCLQTEFLYQPCQHLLLFVHRNRGYPARAQQLEALPQTHQSTIEDLLLNNQRINHDHFDLSLIHI